MTTNFPTEVESIVGPLLAEKGFILDAIDDCPDERGGSRYIVYYRSNDCKIQIYKSSREGEVNCMIAPLSAPNEFGLRADRWQYLTRFIYRPKLPIDELIQSARAEYESYGNPLEWIRDRIAKSYEQARTGILKMYGSSESPES